MEQLTSDHCAMTSMGYAKNEDEFKIWKDDLGQQAENKGMTGSINLECNLMFLILLITKQSLIGRWRKSELQHRLWLSNNYNIV